MKENNNFNFAEVRNNYLIVGEIKNNELESFEVFDLDNQPIVGNIYRGRILNKISGLNAYFIDIGLNKNGFLQASSNSNFEYNEGVELIVQVVSPEDGDKGPKLTDKFELKSGNLILTPFINDFRISKKITDESYVEDLMVKLKPFLPNNTGLIVRTSASEKTIDDLAKELNSLINQYKQLLKEKNFSPTPKLLLKSNYLEESLNFGNEHPIYTNDQMIYGELSVLNSKNNIFLDKKFRIKYNHMIFKQISELFQRNVSLESGIELVFDKTEAFNVIDINSKGFLHKKSKFTLEDVNVKSLKNIIKHLIFRNIYGIILIDFVSYADRTLEKGILDTLFRISQRYKNPPHIVGFTKLGILEMTRNKKVNNLKLEDITIDIF